MLYAVNLVKIKPLNTKMWSWEGCEITLFMFSKKICDSWSCFVFFKKSFVKRRKIYCYFSKMLLTFFVYLLRILFSEFGPLSKKWIL